MQAVEFCQVVKFELMAWQLVLAVALSARSVYGIIYALAPCALVLMLTGASCGLASPCLRSLAGASSAQTTSHLFYMRINSHMEEERYKPHDCGCVDRSTLLKDIQGHSLIKV